MNRQTWIFAGLFVAALITWQWFRNDQTIMVNEQDFQPDFVATNLSSIQYNRQGLPYRGMEAEQAEYYESLSMTLMKKPVILLYSPDGQPQWRLSGDNGTINTGDNAVLTSNVVGKGLQPDALVETLTTEYLEMDFINNRLRSDQTVRLESSQYQAQGTGLLGKLDQQTVELLNETRATYFNP
ncbi:MULTISPECIES: LPS export ABC transporter periplasmic protein LptC [Oceanimonas]|uniref:Lipopolysaccharide export system protein LptC n=1 Tax=Oceanimonas smirnovii TaxID=264574 RepID=A0ABW7P1J2_9GAMM|nr:MULTISPECIES: LPS export ABC transporter periplasmic protein LptC [Oceanimonas]MDV2857985.1 LPS export ABC transporter periplasmic protein LptC [Oceanimonas sp. CAM02]